VNLLGNLIKRGISVGERLVDYPDNVKPATKQEIVLRGLLKKAQNTTFGTYYDFREILKSGDLKHAFRRKIPIFDYQTIYEKWWHLSLHNVDHVTWPGKIKYFALSSGTSGAPSKYIPISKEMSKAMRRSGRKMFFTLNHFQVEPEVFSKGMLMLGGTSSLKKEGKYYSGDLSGINANKLPGWLRPFFKHGAGISRLKTWDERIDAIIKNAPDWDISVLVGIPSWMLLMMEKVIGYYKVKSIHDIWPHLRVIVHGGVHLEPFRKRFEQLMSAPVIYMNTYLASEGFFGYQHRPYHEGMCLELQKGIYYEFIPFHESNFDEEGNLKADATCLTIEEVTTDVSYALLISTCSGAWRYLLGDTIKFIHLERCEFIITGRTKHFLSVCGEHLSVDNMNGGIQKISEELNLSIREFTVSYIEESGKFRHSWYLGCDALVSADKILPLLDEELKRLNDDYRVERNSVLGQPQIRVIPVAVFYKWQEKQGKMGGQNKFPRVMNHTIFKEWESFAREYIPT
jgi:hypothetical protein